MPDITLPDGWVLASDVPEWCACECTDGKHEHDHRDPWRADLARAKSDAAYIPGGHVITRTRVVASGPVTVVEP